MDINGSYRSAPFCYHLRISGDFALQKYATDAQRLNDGVLNAPPILDNDVPEGYTQSAKHCAQLEHPTVGSQRECRCCVTQVHSRHGGTGVADCIWGHGRTGPTLRPGGET